jgi:membrane-associated phospholipid phosphatase
MKMLLNKTKPVSFILLICLSIQAFAQDSCIYKINKGIDIPVTIIGIGGTLGGAYLRQSKPNSDSLTIVSLDPSTLSSLDKKSINQNDFISGKVSDFFLGGGFVIPWVLAFDKHVRNDLSRYSLLYLETMSLAGAGYWGSAGLVDKYRPYVYNPEVSLARKMSKHSKNSFFAGHVTITAAGSFFTAQVLHDLYPETSWNYLGYILATAATGTNGYLRYKGGFHFVSDVVIGATFGAATGILVPVLHKKKKKDQKLGIVPFSGEYTGVYLTYRLN